MFMRNQVRKAFTLIEILIVVVILGILAAIVIPQFTKASEDAQAGNVQTQLQTIRNTVELYRVRNNGAYPFSNTALAWTPLVTPDFLRSAPVNPRTNSDVIVSGTDHTSGATTNGWVWNNTSKTLFASYWDETAKNWTGP
jgi:prepilin-type N-terminal cleavage/methylation domain-containing protein